MFLLITSKSFPPPEDTDDSDDEDDDVRCYDTANRDGEGIVESCQIHPATEINEYLYFYGFFFLKKNLFTSEGICTKY